MTLVVVGCVTFFWILSELMSRGYPEAHDRADQAMAESHAGVIECLNRHESELVGVDAIGRVTARIVPCFDRPGDGRRSYPLDALVGLPDAVRLDMGHSLYSGSYLLDVTIRDESSEMLVLDVGTGSAPEVFMGSTATVTTAQCWTAELDTAAGTLGARERVDCGEQILSIVSGNEAGRTGQLLGE